MKNRRKHISKYTGLTGVQSGHLLKALDKQNIDVQSIDWKTLGGDASDFGDRYKAVTKKLGTMHGISLKPRVSNVRHNISMYESMGAEHSLQDLRNIFDRRKPRSQEIDLRIVAKHTFKHTNSRGVKKWKKHPNHYDIKGVDDM